MKSWEKTYEQSWEKPHEPTDEIDWQESDWFTTFDKKIGLGVTFRLGQELNKKKTNANLDIFTTDGEVFGLNDLGGRGLDSDFTPEDRWENGCRSGGNKVEYIGPGRFHFTWDYPETSGDVEFSDFFYEPRYWTKDDRDEEFLASIHPGGHLESGGRIHGTVRLKSRTFEIDSPAHRDRSWGNRPHYFPRLSSFKFIVADIGPELSFAAQCTQPRGAPPATLIGFVARNGNFDEMATCTTVGKIDLDTGQKIGGTVTIKLENGEVLKAEVIFAKSPALAVGANSFSGFGTVTCNGQTGSCMMSYSGDLTQQYESE